MEDNSFEAKAKLTFSGNKVFYDGEFIREYSKKTAFTCDQEEMMGWEKEFDMAYPISIDYPEPPQQHQTETFWNIEVQNRKNRAIMKHEDIKSFIRNLLIKVQTNSTPRSVVARLREESRFEGIESERKRIAGKITRELKSARKRKKAYTLYEWRMFEQGYVSAMQNLLEQLK